MFFDETNMTIHKYIVKRRLTEAAHKLVYSNMSILDVSFLYGCESQQAFTNAFSRFYKTSPLNYRLKKVWERSCLQAGLLEKGMHLKMQTL